LASEFFGDVSGSLEAAASSMRSGIGASSAAEKPQNRVIKRREEQEMFLLVIGLEFVVK
jgi:hypothetical protein